MDLMEERWRRVRKMRGGGKRNREDVSLVPRLSDRAKATKGWGEEKAAANESLVSTVLRFIRFIA